MGDRYIEVDGRPVEEPNLLKWAQWFETADRHVTDDKVGEVRVSTMFLGLDHSFGDLRGPVLYETLVFGGPRDGDGERYLTREQAIEGHARYLALVREDSNG